MTIEPLRDSLDAALQSWAAPARPLLPSALMCAAAHPLDPSTLCRRLDGHSGTHCADGTDPWAETEETDR